MKLDGMQLLFGADDAGLEQTQSRTGQFSPRPRTQDAAPDGLELLFGTTTQPQQEAAPEPRRPADEPSFWSNPIRATAQAIRGRQDPRFADVPSFEATQSGPQLNMLAAKFLGSGDAAYGDIIASQLGDRLIRREKDANGYEMVVFRGDDGSEQRAYVNRPGLDMEDASRMIAGAVPYVVGGGAVNALTRGFGGLVRAIGQGTAAGATSVATNVAEAPLGSQQGVDKERAVLSAGLGAGGEMLASGVNAMLRSRMQRSLVNPNGTLTQKGEEVARAAGVDPRTIQGEVARTFADTYARTGDAAQAAIRARTGEFGIPTTVGQRTKSIPALLDEKAMRYGGHGERARQVMTDFDRQQREAIEGAVMGRVTVGSGGQAQRTGVATSIAPERFRPRPDELGRSIQQGVGQARAGERAVESAAWEKVPDLIARPGAFDALPDAISGHLGGIRPNQQVTPTAWRMAQELDAYVSGKGITEGAPSVLKQAPIRTVDEMRRVLGDMVSGAANNTDRKAAKAIYDGFNDWIDRAAEQALLTGTPEAAAALRTARAVSREIKGVLAPRLKGGKPSPAARILESIEETDSAEGVLNKLVGSPLSNPKEGSAQALKNLKTLLVDRPAARNSKAAASLRQTWDDIRLAYWMRMVTDRRGDVLATAEGLKNAINTSFNKQRSIIRVLYSPEEQMQMRRLVRALDAAAWKDPNASGTATAGMYYIRQFITKLIDAVGFNSKLVQTGLEYSGLGNALGAARARQAVSQAVRSRPDNRMLSPAAGYLGPQMRGEDQ